MSLAQPFFITVSVPNVWLSQSSDTVGTLSIIQIFLSVSTDYGLEDVDSVVLEVLGIDELAELDALDLLASSSLLDLDADSLADFDADSLADSDAALSAAFASN